MSDIQNNINSRISSLDFLRGIAILGIVLINIESFAYSNPWSDYRYGFETATDVTTRFWVYFLAQGKFWGMLSILFGAGFYLLLNKLEQKQSQQGAAINPYAIYSKRLLWLFVIGVVHAYLLWDGDILYHYAVCGVFLMLFRSFSVKTLLLILLIPIAVITFNKLDRVLSTADRYQTYSQLKTIDTEELTNEQQSTINRWERRYSEKEKRADTDASERTSYLASIKVNASNTKVHKGTFYYKSIVFQTLMLMIIGMMFCKLGIFQNYKNVKYYWLITLSFLAFALWVNYHRYYHWTFTSHEPVVSISQGLMHTFPRELLAVAYVLFLNGLYQRFIKLKYVTAIESVGKMALTNYLMQSVICSFIFYGYGLNYFNQVSRFELLPLVAGITVFTLLFSYFWMKKVGVGPIESWWRKRTYG